MFIFVNQLDYSQLNSDTEIRHGTQKDAVELYKKIQVLVKENREIPFTGAFIDDNDVLNIGLKGNQQKYRNLFKHIAGNTPVKFYETDFTFKELRELQIIIRQNWGELEENGIDINFLCLNEKLGVLEIGLEKVTDEAKHTIVNYLNCKPSALKFIKAQPAQPL